MNTWGAIVFVIILYLAYQLGRLKGRAEMYMKTAAKRTGRGEKVEVADYEEIK